MHETLTLAGSLERFLRKAGDLSLRDVESLPYPARSPAGMKKKTTDAKINVKGTEITVIRREDDDFISLTDMVRNFDGGLALIEQWLKNKDTVLFLGVWEQLNNPNFNSLEFEGIKNEAGRNSFYLSAKKWMDATDARGLS